MAVTWRGALKVTGVGTAGAENFGTAVEGGSLWKVDLAGCLPRALSAITPWSTTASPAGRKKSCKPHKSRRTTKSSKENQKEERASRAPRASRTKEKEKRAARAPRTWASLPLQVAYCIKS